MQPTSMLRTPLACKLRTAAIAAALLGKKCPSPSALMVHGQATRARRLGSQRPDSARAIAHNRPGGMACVRSAAAAAPRQASAGSGEAGSGGTAADTPAEDKHISSSTTASTRISALVSITNPYRL